MSRVHSLACEDKWFTSLCNGTKRIDGRCGAKYAAISPNDVVKMCCNSTEVMFRVMRVTRYPCFAQLLRVEGLENVLPGVVSISDGLKIYRRFYSQEFEATGVYAFELQRLEK